MDLFKLILKGIKSLFSIHTIKDDSRAQKRNKWLFRIGFFLIAIGAWCNSVMKKLYYVCWNNRGKIGKIFAIITFLIFIFFTYKIYQMTINLLNY